MRHPKASCLSCPQGYDDPAAFSLQQTGAGSQGSNRGKSICWGSGTTDTLTSEAEGLIKMRGDYACWKESTEKGTLEVLLLPRICEYGNSLSQKGLNGKMSVKSKCETCLMIGFRSEFLARGRDTNPSSLIIPIISPRKSKIAQLMYKHQNSLFSPLPHPSSIASSSPSQLFPSLLPHPPLYSSRTPRPSLSPTLLLWFRVPRRIPRYRSGCKMQHI